MENEIVNRVANSKLITINLEDFIPSGERMLIDIKDILFQGMILKELDFRQWVKENDWNRYKDAHVAVTCSAEAIVPLWAYMIITSRLSGIAQTISRGNLDVLERNLIQKEIENRDIEDYIDKAIVIKGCFDKPIPDEAYMWITEKIRPFVKSIMYGEPCSTVPVYKAPKKN